MKFRYIGDDNDPPKQTTTLGYSFDLNGKAVEVDEAAATRLLGNRCFKEVKSRRRNGIDES